MFIMRGHQILCLHSQVNRKPQGHTSTAIYYQENDLSKGLISSEKGIIE